MPATRGDGPKTLLRTSIHLFRENRFKKAIEFSKQFYVFYNNRSNKYLKNSFLIIYTLTNNEMLQKLLTAGALNFVSHTKSST